MVKSTGSSPKSTGLSDVVEQLRANNRLIDQQNTNIQSLLNEAKDARLQEKKALVAENRQNALDKKSRLEDMKERRGNVKPRGITGNFVRGAIGGTAYSGLRNMTDGMLGGFGIGAAAGGLARLAGRGLMFATAAAGLNRIAQGALDRVFDDIKPEDIGFKDEQQARDRITGGMNLALGMKFLGFRGRTSLLAGIGTAFGDQITGWIADKMDIDNISMPGWVGKTFGLSPDQMEINLKDPKVGAAVGAAVTLIAGQIAIAGAKAATKFGYNKVKSAILPTNPETLKNQRGFNPNKKPPVVSTNTPVLKSPTSKVDEAVDVVDNIDDAIVRNPNAPKLLNQFGNPISPSVDIDAPKIKSKRLTATNFDEIKNKQDFKKRVLKAEARYKTKMARSTRIKTLFNQIQNNTKLRKGISVGGKVLGAGTLAFSGTMGYLDEERKKAGQTGSQRIVGGIVEDAASTMDMLVDGAVMLPNMLANTLISPFTDFRFKTKNVTDGLAGKTARKGTFKLFEEMNEFNANMKSQENLIRDLGYGGYFNGMNTPPPVIIDNSSGGNTSMSTNNFSSGAELNNKDPYAYGYMGAMQGNVTYSHKLW